MREKEWMCKQMRCFGIDELAMKSQFQSEKMAFSSGGFVLDRTKTSPQEVCGCGRDQCFSKSELTVTITSLFFLKVTRMKRTTIIIRFRVFANNCVNRQKSHAAKVDCVNIVD